MKLFARRFPTYNIMMVLATRMADNTHAEFGESRSILDIYCSRACRYRLLTPTPTS